MSNNYDVVNPYSNRVIASYQHTEWTEVELQLGCLKAGQSHQKELPAHRRAAILYRLAELLEEHAEGLAKLITEETGKTIADSRIEMERAVNATIASAEESRQISGEALDSDAYAPTRGKIGVVCWRPLGTILCITPFNFPINIAMHKIGPAFAAGNCILFKPSPENTASAQLLVELCYRAGMPEQVLQLAVPALTDMAGLIAHPLVDAVNFTGGTGAAEAIARAAGYKKLLLELGGNDPLIVMDDGDIKAAVAAAINQRFATAGQRCTAAKRVFVQQAVYDEFRQCLLAAASELVVGDPASEQTFVGPVINAAAADTVQSRIDQAIAGGATVLLGNRREGNVLYPTILEGVDDDAALMVEETFGPVIPLRAFDTLEELVSLVNNSAFGLQAGVFTTNLVTMRYLFEALEVGTLATNDGPGFRTEHFPFGGVKSSGVGREGIKYAIREMSYQKTLVL
ncbi:lactaldehyde dehydrogenase/sulfoacetaldehyde dehydrogenase [Sinobacterium caligoides]|uniref:Lactaldehyde dehydrogenase/sulfoacetaldehyde dehydrogenase n=1 Tax=Sinobacterium caligoides TaxID=933926 RepID=A0A3N2DPF2_9GAMM|nr:aldehyde dehydrogenase family protein [Sinobacterium caligoides]ROS01694.1 lactaldehyde dehydrogenase/sulfoacetaldehyde dehydrogenase [Sinobacterium caligoides]